MTSQHGDGTPEQQLAKLLGPAEPELSCEACFDQLDAFVEVEFAHGLADASATNPQMVAHLAGCPACREDHDSLLALLRADG